MRKKHLTVLSILMQESDWVTSDYISFNANFSGRTLRNLIKEINFTHPYILSSSKGYKINPEFKQEISILVQKKLSLLTFENQNQRIQYLIKKLLTSGNQLNMYDIADELFVSESTLNSDLIPLRKLLSTYSLELKRKKEGLHLIGPEKNIRKLLNDSIYQEVQDGLLDLNTIQHIFTNLDVRKIRNVLLTIIYDNEMYTNDFSLNNLVLHLCIALNRVSNRLSLEDPTSKEIHNSIKLSDKSVKILSMSHDITSILSNLYNVNFTEAEIRDLSLILEINVMKYDVNQITLSTLEKYVERVVIDFVYEIIDKVFNNFEIDLNSPDFIIRFSLHLNTLRHYCDEYKNPMYGNIKSSFPLLFDVSVFISDLINQKFGIIISKHDISFIALHVGMALEDINDKKIMTILSVPNYHNLRDMVYSQIQSRFSDKLNIITVNNENLNFSSLDNYSLIITTSPLLEYNSKSEIVTISPFLNDSDFHKIKQKIEIIENVRDTSIRHDFLIKFNKSHFLVQDMHTSPEEIIRLLSLKLVETGVVDDSFEDEVHYRESLSNTSYRNLALPHTLTLNAHTSALAVCIVPNGTPWGSNTINVVILLAISKNDKTKFKELFMTLVNTFTSEQWNKIAHKIFTYDDFSRFVEKSTSIS